MNTTLKTIEEILAQAVEIASAQERQAFVGQACADRPDVQNEVQRLLVHHFEAGSFLEVPPSAIAVESSFTVEQPPAERLGSMIGPYKLLEQIGEGGMGIVYMAQQTQPVKRKVALKVIKPGMDTRQVIARFEAERQALALMDHPNIAKVLDAGTVEGASGLSSLNSLVLAPIHC